jgi:type I restriction enzyme, S subunit
MNTDTFFEKFELLADVPGAVERLREIVLELGVTGRLIHQEQEWLRAPLKSLTSKIGSGATPSGGRESYVAKGIPLIRSMNVYFRGFTPAGLVFLTNEQAAELSNVVVETNDVLLNITGASIGRVTTAPPEMAGARVNQHVTIIRPKKELLPRFLAMFLASPSIQFMINDIEVGATRQALTKGMIEKFEIPVPPLAEQRRIVAKVDELMALCDRLEAQQKEREAKHALLAHAALARCAEAPTRENLGYLFHNAYTINPADLRKSILSMAVQGKLTAQKPSDTVSDAIPEILPAEPALEVPKSWLWTKYGEVATLSGGLAFKSGDYAPSGVFILRVTNIEVTGKINKHEAVYLPLSKVSNEVSRFYLNDGDILLVMVGGSLGKIGLVTPEILPALLNQNLWRIVPTNSDVDRDFLVLLTNFIVTFQRQVTHSTHGHFSREEFRARPIALPPLAEQRRIVAKVDALMALVDRLEAQLAESRALGERLLEAIVTELTSSATSSAARR